ASGSGVHGRAGAVRRPKPAQADRAPGRAVHPAGRGLRADRTIPRGYDVRGGAGPIQGALVLVLRHGRLARVRGGLGRAALTRGALPPAAGSRAPYPPGTKTPASPARPVAPAILATGTCATAGEPQSGSGPPPHTTA